ncbi:hypothetical protein PFAG_04078 [Plasmodium falciparum Santa Lucia]|uniref:Uncharacterized protein n=1 Tax=Plasmodium falciparum Santa Lucia TaxID=478859 RepID=W7FEL3_PLAFA|nr:hypothetical protein PFAG_04078 [Plasmodium falciparum Santa Lucia]
MTLSSCGTTNKTMTNIAKDILEGEVSRLKARDVIDKLKGIEKFATLPRHITLIIVHQIIHVKAKIRMVND